jgi:hypothetical protein
MYAIAQSIGAKASQKVVEKLEWRALTSRFCMQPYGFCMSKQVLPGATPAFFVP